MLDDTENFIQNIQFATCCSNLSALYTNSILSLCYYNFIHYTFYNTVLFVRSNIDQPAVLYKSRNQYNIVPSIFKQLF